MILTEKQYKQALIELEQYFDLSDDDPLIDRAEELIELICKYEEIHYPI